MSHILLPLLVLLNVAVECTCTQGPARKQRHYVLYSTPLLQCHTNPIFSFICLTIVFSQARLSMQTHLHNLSAIKGSPLTTSCLTLYYLHFICLFLSVKKFVTIIFYNKNLGLTSSAFYHFVTINVLPKHALSSFLSGSLLS